MNMKKITPLLLIGILSVMLAACSSGNNNVADPGLKAAEMTTKMTEQVEQPNLIELEDDMVQTMYHLDPSLLEDYSIRIPLMNIKSNEIAILKVRDSKDMATVEAAVKQRAQDVQKQFETYLPDQYENAKNYKMVTKGNYVFFVISEEADKLQEVFLSFFEKK